MSKPKFRYEIKRELGYFPHPVKETSEPEFKEDVSRFLDELFETEEEDTVVIRKVKND